MHLGGEPLANGVDCSVRRGVECVVKVECTVRAEYTMRGKGISAIAGWKDVHMASKDNFESVMNRNNTLTWSSNER